MRIRDRKGYRVGVVRLTGGGIGGGKELGAPPGTPRGRFSEEGGAFPKRSEMGVCWRVGLRREGLEQNKGRNAAPCSAARQGLVPWLERRNVVVAPTLPSGRQTGGRDGLFPAIMRWRDRASSSTST